MSTVQPTDKVLVNRAGVDYSQQADTLMATIQDTDLLLVNRAGVDYKCSGLDFKASMKPVESVDKPRILTPVNNAVDLGDTTTLTSSPFVGHNGATHVSTDWQVTLKADTAFASPAFQSMADTTHKLSWDATPLKANTDYIARVRYHSAGVVSAWSDVVGFKTKDLFVSAADPSDLWQVSTGAAVNLKYTAPVKFINAAGLYSIRQTQLYKVAAVGTDGKLYIGKNTAALSVAPVTPPAGVTAPIVAVSGNYTADLIVIMYGTGQVCRINIGAPPPWTANLVTNNAIEIGNYSSISNVWFAVRAGNIISAFVSGAPTDITIPLGAGETLKSFGCIDGDTTIAGAKAWVALASSGNLYLFKTAITAGNRTLLDTDVSTASSAGGGSGPNGGVYTKNTGEVFTVDRAGVKTKYSTGCLDAMKPYAYPPITLKTDGSIYVGATQVSDAGIHGLRSFGQLPNCSASAADEALIFTGN